jgi:hypothetical protein
MRGKAGRRDGPAFLFCFSTIQLSKSKAESEIGLPFLTLPSCNVVFTFLPHYTTLQIVIGNSP